MDRRITKKIMNRRNKENCHEMTGAAFELHWQCGDEKSGDLSMRMMMMMMMMMMMQSCEMSQIWQIYLCNFFWRSGVKSRSVTYALLALGKAL